MTSLNLTWCDFGRRAIETSKP